MREKVDIFLEMMELFDFVCKYIASMIRNKINSFNFFVHW